MTQQFMGCALFTAALLIGVAGPAIAQDKQGKHTLEQNRSRPKENKPPQTGSQRTQDQTRERTEKALARNSAARRGAAAGKDKRAQQQDAEQALKGRGT